MCETEVGDQAYVNKRAVRQALDAWARKARATFPAPFSVHALIDVPLDEVETRLGPRGKLALLNAQVRQGTATAVALRASFLVVDTDPQRPEIRLGFILVVDGTHGQSSQREYEPEPGTDPALVAALLDALWGALAASQAQADDLPLAKAIRAASEAR